MFNTKEFEKEHNITEVSPLAGEKDIQAVLKKDEIKRLVVKQFQNGVELVLYVDKENRKVLTRYEL